MDTNLYEFCGWFLLSVLKFVITPSAMIASGHSWLVTLVTVGISSSLGFSAFYFFGEAIFKKLGSLRKKPKKVFTKANRKIVHIKSKYGLLGMGIIAGVISVPLAGLVTAKFFHHDRKAIPSIILAFLLWTLVLTSLSWLIRNVFHGSL